MATKKKSNRPRVSFGAGRRAAAEHLVILKEAATGACVCTPEMKKGLVVGGEEVSCKPCSARELLKGVVTLAELLIK